MKLHSTVVLVFLFAVSLLVRSAELPKSADDGDSQTSADKLGTSAVRFTFDQTRVLQTNFCSPLQGEVQRK